ENINGSSTLDYNDMYHIEDGSKVPIKKINSKSIGEFKDEYNIKILKLRNIEFKYNMFNNCKFKNIEFYNCTFYGNEFLGCNFKNVKFINCNFYNQNECILIFDRKTVFIDCEFKNCNMEKSIFENIDLHNVNFEHTNLKGSIFTNSYIDNVYIADCDLRSCKIINPDIKAFEFEDNYITKFDEDTFIDKIEIDKKYRKSYEVAFKVYKSVASKFEANGLFNNAGEYYYIAKCMEYKYSRGVSKFNLAIFWLLCGYGERPTYALITSLEIVLIFAIMYMITGLNIGGDSINYLDLIIQGKALENLNVDFMKSLYFSIVTFTTVGYGDITPTGLSVFLSGIEMLLGVTMVGIWTATLARKITR
ncbi:MAG: pentapeptide repeat-containing protein, partial [Romboutsia sp.]|uniref:pentapeptide repeat-containing protein n=1 Tax=Romboutsia sp. TaxID=1965302 RepID=UPI003F36BE75